MRDGEAWVAIGCCCDGCAFEVEGADACRSAAIEARALTFTTPPFVVQGHKSTTCMSMATNACADTLQHRQGSYDMLCLSHWQLQDANVLAWVTYTCVKAMQLMNKDHRFEASVCCQLISQLWPGYWLHQYKVTSVFVNALNPPKARQGAVAGSSASPLYEHKARRSG